MTELLPHPQGIPLPQPTAITQPFWDGCGRHELLFQHCRACGLANFDPQPICRHCRSDEIEWQRSAGLGVVETWTVVWRPQMPVFRVPYAPAIVRLAEGFDMVSTIIGCDPERIHRSMAVAVEFHPIGDGVMLPYFAPVAGSPS